MDVGRKFMIVERSSIASSLSLSSCLLSYPSFPVHSSFYFFLSGSIFIFHFCFIGLSLSFLYHELHLNFLHHFLPFFRYLSPSFIPFSVFISSLLMFHFYYFFPFSSLISSTPISSLFSVISLLLLSLILLPSHFFNSHYRPFLFAVFFV